MALTAPSALASVKRPSAADRPAVAVVVNKALSSQTRLVLDVTLPGLEGTRLIKKIAPNGKPYYKVVMHGLTTSFDPKRSPKQGLGTPGLPAISVPFAIPESAGTEAEVAGVRVTVPKVWFKNTFPKYQPFPASYEALDGEEFGPTPTVAVSQGRTACANTEHTVAFSCWGLDSQVFNDAADDFVPVNAFNAWLESLADGNADASAVNQGRFESVAIGESGTGNSASSVCTVGGEYFKTPGVPEAHALNCFGDQGSGWGTDGLSGAGSKDTDVKEVGASAALTNTDPSESTDTPTPSEFCLLRNIGSSSLWDAGNGEVYCFGRSDHTLDWASPPMTDPESGSASHYVDLSVGFNHACALVESGRPRCWGGDWDANSASIPTPLPVLKKVEAGRLVDCGIKSSDSKLVCWGVGAAGVAALAANPLPASASGPVSDISISESAACVLSLEGELSCFRFDVEGATPTSNPLETGITQVIAGGRYKSVEVGGRASGAHACAVTIANKIVCWGSDANGESSPGTSVNETIGWNDPLFNDFIGPDIAPGLQIEETRPFLLDEASYASPNPVPAGSVSTQGGPVQGTSDLFNASAIRNQDGTPARLRQLGVGRLHLFGAQYISRFRLLRLFSKVRVQIDFTDAKTDSAGNAVFGTPTVDPSFGVSPSERSASSLVNADYIRRSAPSVGRRAAKAAAATGSQCGEEMLVIAPREFSSAANAFVAGKNQQGMLSRFVAVEDVGGANPDSVRDFVQGEFSTTDRAGNPCVAPAYLTLIGTTAKVPTFPGDSLTSGTGSDIDYSLPVRNTYIPDLAVGRIPAATADDASAAVAKILAYETTSPSSAPAFFNNVTLTSFFQNTSGTDSRDQRGFVRSAEQLRAALMVTGVGKPAKTVERLYSTAYAGGRTKMLNDDLGRAFPKDIQTAQSAPPWSLGSQASVVGSINSGRFLVISRDHGDFDRIYNPAYGAFKSASGAAALDQMTNGSQTPVAWFLACLTGKFDNPGTPSLAEQLVMKRGGGMVGVIGSSRVSPSEPNNSLLLALADAVWPSVLPTGGTKPIYRMGDVMNTAKLAVLMSGGPSASVDINNEMRLYNWFGDPSMQLWTVQPAAVPTTGVTASATATNATVTFPTAVADGASVALLANDVPIGRATVNRGRAVITPAYGVPTTGSLKAVIVMDQALPTTVVVR